MKRFRYTMEGMEAKSTGCYILFTDHEAALKESDSLKRVCACDDIEAVRADGDVDGIGLPTRLLIKRGDQLGEYLLAAEAAIKKAVEDERARTDTYHTVVTVMSNTHKCGKVGRLPIIDFLPESLIGQEVEVIIRQRGAQ